MTAQRDIEPNDPTRSGAPLPTGKGARLSRNEIEQLCLKAARGAGMSWGLAEEAGFAAAWLALRGLDGPGVLLAQLRADEARPWREICPVIEDGAFRAEPGGHLCPIALGTALCDHAGLPQTDSTESPLTLGPVGHPILLLPFLAELARLQGARLRLDWPQGAVLVAGDGALSGDIAALAQAGALDGRLSRATEAAGRPASQPERLFVPSETLRALNAFALRTTVPASEASRAGAGAAAGDND